MGKRGDGNRGGEEGGRKAESRRGSEGREKVEKDPPSPSARLGPAGARESGSGWGTRGRPRPSAPAAKASRPVLRVPPPALRSGGRGALGVSECLCAPGASRAEHRGAAGRATAPLTPARGGAAPAPHPPRPRPAAGATGPARPRGGAGSAWPRPAGTAEEGGARPGTSALEERSRHYSAPPAPATQWPGSPRGAPLPAARPPRESALTSGQRGAVVDGDPDLLHSALGQLQGHLHSLDSAALRPPRRIQDLGRRAACRPPKQRGRGVRARELSRALLFGNVLCAKSLTLARGVRLHEHGKRAGS